MATPQQDPHNPDAGDHGAHGEGPAPDTSRGYEYTDLRLKGVIIFLVTMVAATIVIHFMVYKMMEVYHNSDARNDPAPSPLLARAPDGEPIRSEPPPPLLQPYSPDHPNTEPTDLGKMRKEDHYLLESYGTARSDPASARIPIQRAMELVAERGLPVAAPVAAPATRPAHPSASVNPGDLQ